MDIGLSPDHPLERARGRAVREAMTAGMPTPSYAAPQTARPGTAATAARIRATRSRWPTAYCGRPPPQRCTWVSTGVAATPTASRRSAERPGDQLLVGGLQGGLLAVPAERGAQQEQAASSAAPASRTQPHLAKENVEALIRRRRPAGPGSPDESVAGELRAPTTRRTRRSPPPSRRTRSPPARPRPTGATEPSSRAVGAAGVASTTASAATSSGAVVGPTVSAKPVGVARQLAHRRAGADVEPGGQRLRQLPHAAGDAGEDRRRPTVDAPAAIPPSARVTSCGTVARTESQPRVPGVHAAEQRLDQAVGDLGAEAGVDEVADGRRPRRPARVPPSRNRASPSGDSTPEAASWSRSSGTPISERGSGRSASRVQIREDAHVGCSIGRPRLRARSTPSGRRLSIASAPTSTVTPATGRPQQLAADARRRLEHEHVVPGGDEVAGGGQPGDAGTDDHDPAHGSTLPEQARAAATGAAAATRERQAVSARVPKPLRWKTSGCEVSAPCMTSRRVQLEQHDRVVAGLDLAVDRAVEHRQAVVEGDRAVVGRRDREVVEAVRRPARPAGGRRRRGGRRGSSRRGGRPGAASARSWRCWRPRTTPAAGSRLTEVNELAASPISCPSTSEATATTPLGNTPKASRSRPASRSWLVVSGMEVMPRLLSCS